MLISLRVLMYLAAGCLQSWLNISSGHAVKIDTNYNMLPTRNQILFTSFRLIFNQTKSSLVPNQSENGKYNLILVVSTRMYR